VTDHRAYAAAILRFIEWNRGRYDFACVVFQRDIGQCDDWLVDTLRRNFPSATVVYVDSVEAARALASSIDVILTTRFHLGLLGVLWGKPVIVIDHELKMTSLAEQFALPSITLNDFIAMPTFDIAALLGRWDVLVTKTRLEAQQSRVALNFSWLNDSAI
jgi:polysaccharide pyruvyl transferase WcaK-like protein